MPFPCHHCASMRVNGTPIHETGCPDAWRDYDRNCRECGCPFRPETSDRAVCDDCIRADEPADPFSGSFMQPQVYKGAAWRIETYNGTETIPDDVVSLAPFTGDEDSAEYSAWLQDAIAKLTDYCEGAIIEVPNAPTAGWLGRMSASGYSDCTDWCLYDSESEAMQDLADHYGNNF